MAPFEQDLFSVSIPIWTECETGSATLIAQLLKCHIEAFDDSDLSISQVGGLEINSSNFKVTAKHWKHSVVLKKWPNKHDVDKIISHNEILRFLNNRNIPSPHILNFDKQNDHCLFEGNHWTLQSFQAGSFFNGELEQGIKLIPEAVNLHSALNDFDLKPSGGEQINHSYDIIKELIKPTAQTHTQFEAHFSRHHADILKTNWELIIAEYELASSALERYQQKRLCHIDLHPHNILTDAQGIVSFLDIDSVRFMNYPIAMAYFALKTCKQICVNKSQLEPSKVGNRFLEQLTTHCTEAQAYAKDLSYLANAEVLRRICIILQLSIKQKNAKWNQVLPILTNHLVESKILFR